MGYFTRREPQDTRSAGTELRTKSQRRLTRTRLLLYRAGVPVATFIARTVAATYRIVAVVNEECFDPLLRQGAVIPCYWHQHLLVCVRFLLAKMHSGGPFKLGFSYLNNHEGLGDTALVNNGTLDTNRYAGGVVYTYGPGMTFRGSVGWVRSTLPGVQLGVNDPTHVHATDLLFGTQINF